MTGVQTCALPIYRKNNSPYYKYEYEYHSHNIRAFFHHLTKASQLTAGWHEDENGKWYQNVDGTYYAGGLQEIDGSTYYFGEMVMHRPDG